MSGCCSFLPCCPERVSFKSLLWEELPDSIAWRGQITVIDPKEEPGCCVTVVLSRLFAEVIAGLSFLDVPGNIILATLKLASLPIVLIGSSCSECCAVFWQAMGNYYDAICDLLLGMTVLFSWVYPDVVYTSMQNAKIDSLLRAISQEYTSVNRAVEITRAISHDTQDVAVRTRAALALLDKLGKQTLTKENIEQVFSVANVAIKAVPMEDPATSQAMVDMIKKAANQVPAWENLPLLFQVVDAAHVHFAENVGVRRTCAQITLREVMKKEGCSTENLLAISQKLREHFKEGDNIYKQQIAEEIGLLLQNGEARFGKEGGAQIFAEVETHYFPAFDARIGSFDWKPLTERYKPAAPEEKKSDEISSSGAKAEAAKTEMAKGAEEESGWVESDAESEHSDDSHVIKTPKAASAPATMETPVTPQTAGSSKEAVLTASPKQTPGSPTAAQRSPSPELESTEGETDGTEHEPVDPITPRSPSPSMTVSPVKEAATAEKSVPAQKVEAPAEEDAGQSKSAPASPRAVFVPIDETAEEPKQEAEKPAAVAAAVPATPFSSPAVPSFQTPVSKSRLGPPLRVSTADQSAQMQSPEVAPIKTVDRDWLLQTSKLGGKTAANGGTLPPAWDMSPGTQVALNTDAIGLLSPMAPLPTPIYEENTGDLASLPSLPSASKTATPMSPLPNPIDKETTRNFVSPLSGSKAATLTRAEVIEAREMFKYTSAMSPLRTETAVHESDDGQQIRFHDGDTNGAEKKSMSETT